jgi:hypothetical protein
MTVYLSTPLCTWRWSLAPNQSQSYLTTNNQSDSLPWCQATIRALGQVFFLLENFCVQFRVYFVAPSLTRGRACNLLLLLGLTSTVPLGSESRGTQEHIIVSQFFRFPQPGVPSSRIYIPQEQGGPVIPAGTGFTFRRLLRLAGLRWRYSNPSPDGHTQPLVWVIIKRSRRVNINRSWTDGIGEER